jgi:opacity protein-like surface antigen
MILLLSALLGVAVLATPAAIKIKTRTETAVFRLEPNPAGEIAREKIVLGTKFDVERKNGDWYEVKLQSESGALLLVYIHESDVELVAEAQPAPKPAVQPPPARTPADRTTGWRADKSLVLSLGGGPVFPSTWDATSTYRQWLWPYVALQSLAESNTLALSLKPPTGVGLGLGLTYSLSPRLGIQFRIDIMSNRSISDGRNDYAMTWKWLASSKIFSLDPPPTWPIVGYLRAQPVSLGLVARFPVGSRLQPYLQAGVAYFLCRFKVESQIGYARTWVEEPYQYVDYFTLPVSIDEFFNGVGFTGGAGLDWLLGSKMAVFVQADYFVGPSQEVGWDVEPGTYSAHFSSITRRIDAESARVIRSYISPFTVKVGGLFRLLAGFKILL